MPGQATAEPKHLISEEGAESLSVHVSNNPERFSGFWFEHETNRYVVAVPKGADKSTAFGEMKKYSTTKAGKSGKLGTLALESREYSLAELQRKLDEVTAARKKIPDQDRSRSTWYVQQRLNKVVIETKAVDISAEARKLGVSSDLQVSVVHTNSVYEPAVKRYEIPSGVTPRVVNVPATKSGVSAAAPPNRLLDVQDYYTGNRIYWYDQPNNRLLQCTSGSVNYPKTYMYTAGHCFPQGVQVEQGYYEPSNNTLYRTGTIGTVVDRQWGDNRIDAETIETRTYTNIQFYGSVDSPSSYRQTNSAQFEGTRVCGNGSVSGTRCTGEVRAVNVCVDYPEADPCGITIARPLGDVQLAQPGDSGGPVIKDEVPGYITVLGLISGIGSENNDLFYTPMAPACAQLRPHTCD